MKLLTIDFETFYSSEYSLSKMTTESYIRDERFKAHGCGLKLADGPSVWVTADKLQAVFDKIDWSQVALICQNTMFDGAILAWHYGRYPALYCDTLGMSRALIGAHSARHGLSVIAPLLGVGEKGADLAKTLGIRDLSPQLEAVLASYCKNDCDKTRAIFNIMAKHFPKGEYKAIDWTVRAFTDPKVWLDGDMLSEYLANVRQAKADALVDAGLEDRSLLMSNPKLAEALENLGCVPPTKINAKGKVTLAMAKTDEGFKALLEHPNPQVAALVAARLEVKSTIEETRAQRFLEASDRGAFPMPYSYAGANVTQRFSGADGVNVQNLPRSRYGKDGQYIEGTGMLRRAIYAPEGYTLCVADLAQIEARITLWFGSNSQKAAGDEQESLDLLANGGDLYSWFGSKIYNRPINKRDNPTERQVAKSAVLGLGYGMGPARFIDYCAASDVKITDEDAANIVSLYRNTFRGVKAIWRELAKALTYSMENRVDLKFDELPVSISFDPMFGNIGFVRPCGLMVKYPDLHLESDDNGRPQMVYRQGAQPSKLFGGKLLEGCSQSLAGDMLRSMMLEIDKQYKVVATTHDELVCLVPMGQEVAAETFVREVMTRTPDWMPGLPLGVEIGFGQRYGEVK